MHDVFVSHSTRGDRDKMIADAICAKLEERKIRCWIAPRDVRPGSTWAESIVDAIAGSRLMVLVFSAEANTSPHVMREVERAVSRGIPILPFRIEEVVPSKAMEFFISSSHWLDAMTPPLEAHIARLSGTIEALIQDGQPSASATAHHTAASPPELTDPDFDPLLFGRIFADDVGDSAWLKAGKALCREGKLVRAAQMYRASAKTAEQLAAGDPSGSNFSTWFFIRYHLAHVLSVCGDLPGALAEYRRIREIAERGAALANAESHHASFRSNVVSVRAVAGDLLRRIGNPDEALREYRLALAAAKTNVEQHSDNFSGPDQVWWIGVKIGDLLADQGDTHGALTAYREALDAGNRMDDFHRNSSSWQRSAIEIQGRIDGLSASTG